MPGTPGSPNGLQWVDRAVAILESVARSPNGMRITELSETHQIPKSTLHRILTALKGYEYIIQDSDTKRYSVGPALLRLGTRFLEQFPLRDVLRPHLHRLALQTHLASFSALLVNDKVLCADTVVGDYGPLSLFVRVGRTLPLHTSSAAKVIVAYLPEQKIRELLHKSHLHQYTPFSKTQIDDILGELRKVRALGVATSFEETQVGTFSVSAPVFGPKGRVLASVSVVGPIQSQNPTLEAELEETLKRMAGQISMEIGFPFLDSVPDHTIAE